MPSLAAGRLCHRITIERPVKSQDPTTGGLTTTWEAVATVAAAIEPLSAREFVAAQALQSRVDTRITIRFRAGLTPNMRLVSPDGAVYRPAGFLPDPDSGRAYLTIPCATC